MKILYKPLSIIAGFVSARLGRSVFQSVWTKIDEAPPPVPGTGEASLAKVVGAQALQAAVMAGVAAAVDRGFARSFHHLVGAWPSKPPKPEPEPEN
jgi:Protein of unknown function (DUF4235)